ncbi:unnamed protein product [Peniophora sp. CBMAI 1063]|nr:unnamed protein product [Peniophora sp. CBMAI 1063]
MFRLGSVLNVQHSGLWTVKPQYDVNQANQLNPHFIGLRDRAQREGDAMARAFNASQVAYRSGQGARAKELSEEGNTHKAEMERLNREASLWIFRENNRNSQSGDIDLHGLYVKEAVKFAERAIIKAQRKGHSEIQFIVGKGLRSPSAQVTIRSAIEDLISNYYRFDAAYHPDNAGVLVVRLKPDGALGCT